jgi:choline dehydrogenase
MSFAVVAKSLPSATIAVGASKGVGKEVVALGGTKAFLVTDPGVTGAGITAQIEASLKEAGLEVVVFDSVLANPTMSIVQRGIKILRDDLGLEGTVIVSVGGGSSMDAAKAMAVVAPDGGESVAEYCMQPQLKENTDQIDMMSMLPTKAPAADALPIIAIPTTSGTASETNGGAVLTDDSLPDHRKLIFSAPSALAKLTILDPELTLKLPAYPTATCGMDALVHSIEALPLIHFITDSLKKSVPLF